MERRLARQEVVQDRTEAINVSSRRYELGLSGGLLRSHVTGSAHDRSGLSKPWRALNRSREPEVADVRPACGIQQDVPRLQVAVQDSVLMSVMHRLRD